MTAYWWWLAIANAIAVVAFGVDKLAARLQRRRLREAWLLWTMLGGGCVGGWAAMHLFRHKTQKASFRRWAVAATAGCAALAWLLWR